MSKPFDAASPRPNMGAEEHTDSVVGLDAGQPRRIGRYRLCFELAAGGMGTVYLARADGPPGFERLVAIKSIHRHLARNKNFVDMFLDEARIATRLSHPNVCTVYDFGEADGVYYIAMEYLLGETFSRLLRRIERRPELVSGEEYPLYAARIVADACEGLHAAHELRDDNGELLHVVHRDVSLQNLFLNYDGSVRVVDFGIARAAGQLHETRTGQLKGKLGYVAPEQIKKQDVDRRADVWALGVVAWELLAGKRLFKRDSDIDTILAVAQDPIDPPSVHRPEVPPELDRIVLRALNRDRDQRYATARDLGRDLGRVLASSNTAAGMGELGDWMHKVFAREHARRLAIMDAARTLPDEGAPVLAADMSEDAASEEGEGVVSAIVTKSTMSRALASLADVSRPAPRGKRRILGVLGALVLVLTGVALFSRGGEEEVAPEDTETAMPLRLPPRIGAAGGRADEGVPSDEEPVGDEATPEGAGTTEEGPDPEPKSQGERVRRGLDSADQAHVPRAGGGGGPGGGVAGRQPGPEAGEGGRQPGPEAGEGGDPTPGAEVDAEPEGEGGVQPTAADEPPEASDEAEAGEAGADSDVGNNDSSREAAAGGSRSERRRKPRPPQRQPSGEPGTVTVITLGGWADLYRGGEFVGRTPTQVQLPAGRHVLALRPFGRGPTVHRRVRVGGGDSSRLVVRLSK